MTSPRSAMHLSSNFEEFAALLHGFDMDICQLERGAFSASSHQVFFGETMLSHFRVNRRLEVNGASPAGLLTFGIPLESCNPFTWRNQTTDGNTIQIYRRSTELAVISDTFFESIDVSLPEDSLNQWSQALGLPEVRSLIGDKEMVRSDPACMQALRIALCRTISLVRSNPSIIHDKVMTNEMDSEISRSLLYALHSALPPTQSSSSLKLRSVNQAVNFIKNISDENVELKDLCRVANVSERTLQYKFKSYLGLSPKRYLRVQRLNMVYKKLSHSNATDTKIADIANECGFFHLGQFAADYRRHFGELPSETLNRARDF